MNEWRNPSNWVRGSLCASGLCCAILMFPVLFVSDSRCFCQPPADNEEWEEDSGGTADFINGDDFEPGTQAATDTYAKSTDTYKFPGFDGSAATVFKTVGFYATSKLRAGHCLSSDGTLRKHAHAKDDYDATAKTNADNYWNMRFDTKNGTCTLKTGASTNKTNCYAYALATFTKKGIYQYWMNAGAANFGEATACFGTDTSPVDVSNAKCVRNDVIYYFEKHATGIVDVDCNGKASKLEWQWQASGIYQYSVPGTAADRLHTPFFDTKQDSGPGGADTKPANTVRRPN
jgi:hypothetical protein